MTSDNWEGLKYGGVAGGKQVTPDNILHFILSPLLMFEILIFSALKTINFQRLSVGAIQHLADMQESGV